MEITYQMPTNTTVPTNRYEVATNIAFFLLANGQSIFGHWKGRMKATDQRKLFGVNLGRGTLYINGANDTVECWVKVCFGTDANYSAFMRCRTGELHANSTGTKVHGEIEKAKEWFHA